MRNCWHRTLSNRMPFLARGRSDKSAGSLACLAFNLYKYSRRFSSQIPYARLIFPSVLAVPLEFVAPDIASNS